MTASGIPTQISSLIKNIFREQKVHWPKEDSAFEAAFFEVIFTHGLVAVIHNLDYRTGCCSNWPDTLKLKIGDITKRETAIALVKEKELKNILKVLRENNIYPLLIKGVPLSYVLYSVPCLRPHSDIDLLIQKKDRYRLASIMETSGYESYFNSSADFLSTQTTFKKHDNLGLEHSYDIHWQINNIKCSFTDELSYENLIGTARYISELGSNVRTITNIDALLLACFHRAVHFSFSGERLIWLYDIHLLIESMSADEFHEFYKKAKNMKIIILCSDAILNAREWFNTYLPDAWLSHLQSLPLSEVSVVLLKAGRMIGIKNHALLELKELSSWNDRKQFISQKVFPPVDYMMWRYNVKIKLFIPFLYFYRLLYGIYVFVKG